MGVVETRDEEEVEKAMITTDAHRQKVMQRYQWYKAQGICPICKWRPSAPGHVLCEGCMKPKKAVGIHFKGPNEPTRWELIMADLAAGEPYSEIAKRYKTGVTTIKVYDRVRKGELPKPTEKVIAPADLPIVELYLRGYGIESIARGKSISNDAVSWILEQAGISKRGTKRLHIPTEQELSEIAAAWERGESSNVLAKKYNVSIYRIKRYMEMRGAQRPWSKDAPNEAEWEQAARDYVAGATYKEIAQRFHISPATVGKKLADMGVQIRSREERSRRIANEVWAKRRAMKNESGAKTRHDARTNRKKRDDAGSVQPGAED